MPTKTETQDYPITTSMAVFLIHNDKILLKNNRKKGIYEGIFFDSPGGVNVRELVHQKLDELDIITDVQCIDFIGILDIKTKTGEHKRTIFFYVVKEFAIDKKNIDYIWMDFNPEILKLVDRRNEIMLQAIMNQRKECHVLEEHY